MWLVRAQAGAPRMHTALARGLGTSPRCGVATTSVSQEEGGPAAEKDTIGVALDPSDP